MGTGRKIRYSALNKIFFDCCSFLSEKRQTHFHNSPTACCFAVSVEMGCNLTRRNAVYEEITLFSKIEMNRTELCSGNSIAVKRTFFGHRGVNVADLEVLGA